MEDERRWHSALLRRTRPGRQHFRIVAQEVYGETPGTSLLAVTADAAVVVARLEGEPAATPSTASADTLALSMRDRVTFDRERSHRNERRACGAHCALRARPAWRYAVLIAADVRAYICREPVDMRKSIDALSYLVEPLLAQKPNSGNLFVFVGRDRQKVRCLYWDRTGFALWYN
nr:IS66 family insertion sequence element accessory protein TnpB [Caballeronia calidae]